MDIILAEIVSQNVIKSPYQFAHYINDEYVPKQAESKSSLNIYIKL